MSLHVNEICFDEEQDILSTVKNQEKVKALLNGVDVGNVEQWTQISSG